MPEAVIPELEPTQLETLPEIEAATENEILDYLRRSARIAEIASEAEREMLILKLCETFDLTVSEAELQAAGNEFRRSHHLLEATQAQNWLIQQRIAAADWTEGIRVKLLEQKLKVHLFGAQVDSHYLNHRKEYKRVALSQILVPDRTVAQEIVRSLQAESVSFCALAIEHSQGKTSKEKGGFAGVHFLPKLMPEIAEAIKAVSEGEVIGPIQTKLGYHVLKIEKWFPVHLTESLRQELLDVLFQNWLKQRQNT